MMSPYHEYTPLPTRNPGKESGIAALVLGIISLFTNGLFPFFSFPLGVVAIVLGAVSRRKTPSGMPSTLATVGIITGAIGVIISILLFILGIIGLFLYINMPNGLDYI
jgi:hypothetical protein